MMTHEFTEAVQAAVVTTINTIGATLLGPKFTPITSSPIPDDEVARIAGMDFTVCGTCDGGGCGDCVD
jgi:hypothetical protein